jgi:AcrR family transcriptional regulator
VAVAERLFAERGVEAVSLREVGKAAASRNTAVAHYHFGGKEGLIRAIVARRAPVLNSRRAGLLDQARERAAARGQAVPAAELVRALVVPLIEELDRGGYYVGFLARLAAERHRAPWVAELDDSSTASCRAWTGAVSGIAGICLSSSWSVRSPPGRTPKPQASVAWARGPTSPRTCSRPPWA